MQIIIFGLGVLTGFLIRREVKNQVAKRVREFKEEVLPGRAQFIEPVSYKEKFQKAKTIDDLLN